VYKVCSVRAGASPWLVAVAVSAFTAPASRHTVRAIRSVFVCPHFDGELKKDGRQGGGLVASAP
jgi:hypothetical protein